VAEEADGRVALMAIHPRYANAILDGTKQVEFRKRRVASDIRTVLIYATSPVQRILGSFRIAGVVVDHPEAIWGEFGGVGTIERDDFSAYYASSDSAVAIKVADTERFEPPLALSDLDPRPGVPQSFTYISADILGVTQVAD
jgi:predicted transcriptional regulator